MKPQSLRLIVVAAVVAAGLAAPLILRAQSAQISAAPRYVPMGVSGGDTHSTAWFHEAQTGKALACTIAMPSGTSVRCVPVQLP